MIKQTVKGEKIATDWTGTITTGSVKLNTIGKKAPASGTQKKIDEVKISVDPKFGYLVQTRILDGKKYIVISADSGVEINGVSVSIAQ